MKNFGISDVRVFFKNKAPNIARKKPTFNFDIHASQFKELISNSPFLRPFLIEYVEGDTFAACFPQKGFLNRNNFIRNSIGELAEVSGLTSSFNFGGIPINWKATTNIGNGYFYDLINNETNPFDKYELKHPDQYDDINYIGPMFETKPHSIFTESSNSDKNTTLKSFLNFLIEEEKEEEEEEEEDLNEEISLPEFELLMWVHQTQVKDGLWWALESDPFLYQNMPFFVRLKVQEPPTSSVFPTEIVISLGVDDVNRLNRYDLVLSVGKQIKLFDYWRTQEAGSTESSRPAEPFIIDAIYNGSQEEMTIGFMTIAGRLVIFFISQNSGNSTFVYERTDLNGQFRASIIPQGRIRVMGTNIQAGVNVTPMSFSPLGAMCLRIATVEQVEGVQQDLIYVGVPPDADENVGLGENNRREVCELPIPLSNPTYGAPVGVLYGVDCKIFKGENKDVFPIGPGYHRQGSIRFLKVSDWLKERNLEIEYSDYYLVIMEPENILHPTLGFLEYTGCPYYFRLKGRADIVLDEIADDEEFDASNFLLSLDESTEAPDYNHIEKKVNLTLYNKGGVWDFLRKKQYAVEVSFGRDDRENLEEDIILQKTFTGITISTSNSETAGMEILTVQCNDYMYILNTIPIINSPFYDGIIAFYAMKDIAKKGGIIKVNINWLKPEAYFLPAGFAFTKPSFRFPSENMLLECMLQIAALHEAYFYFDENGELWIEYIPGGMIGGGILGREIDVVYEFKTDPSSDPAGVILENKNINIDFSSTVNKINVFTIDRNTRNLIHVGYSASESVLEDKLLFDKYWFAKKPELGEVAVARSYIREVATRLFNPIKTVTFKTVGSSGTDHIKPLDFITVDDQLFRITNITRSFSAENNDYTIDFTGEALGI